MKISIIVPIYNCSNYIDKCIFSLIHQTYRNIEIILVNDGSTDNSLEKILEYQNQDNRIKIVNQSNQGVSSARNQGIKNANGKYITFVDSDDYLDNDAIEKLVNHIEPNTVVKINYKTKKQNQEKIHILPRTEYSVSRYKEGILKNEIGGFCWGYLFEKEKIEYFDETTSYLEDTLFLLQYLTKINKIKIVENSYYNYCFNDNSITKNNNRIIKNIIDFNYSLNEIKKYSNQKNQKQIITNKKIKLIEAELAKTTSNHIRDILNNKDLINIIKSLSKEKNLNLFYKLYFKIILSKNYLLFSSYLKIRKTLKSLKNKGR